MSKTEKDVYPGLMRRRYASMRTKRARGRTLDSYCAKTGLSRKHVIKKLSPKRRPARRRGCPTGGRADGTALLIRLWKLSDMLCGELLKPVLGLYLESFLRHETIPVEFCSEVLSMSASTIDRRLRKAKKKVEPARRRRRRAASLDAHRREVPLKVEAWDEAYPHTPGFIEVDTVAHCGGSMAGSFAWTLTMTDVATHWTELETVWNKGQEAVCRDISSFIARVPFTVHAINSDNGGEFLNAHLKRHFARYFPTVLRTRSRPYRKNENAHVEQKNGVHMRSLYGHARIADAELLGLMNEINRLQGLIKNLFTPTMRLLSKERPGGRTGVRPLLQRQR